MATHDVDKKILGRLALLVDESNPALAQGLFQLLGLSELLSRRLLKARKHRKARNRTPEAVSVYHHVIWMSREGLAIVENFFALIDTEDQYPAELRVFFYKLRASFYHIFVLFHNNPRVSLTAPSKTTLARTTPLSPASGNGNGNGPRLAPPGKDESPDSGSRTRSRTPRRTRGNLRDPIISVLSEESAVTNPWGALSPPPGLGGIRQELQPAPDPAAFLLPSANYLSMASACFSTAHSLAMAILPGSAPLRLSVGLEYCAFLWDCEHDHDGCRKLASETINYVWEAQEGMEDDAFEDAAQLVGTLGRMMRRRSQEDTPQMGPGSPDNPGVTGNIAETDDNPPPPLPKDDPPRPSTTNSAAPREAAPNGIPPEPAPRDPVEHPQVLVQSASMSIPRRPVGTPTKAQPASPLVQSPTRITRKAIGSPPKRTASPSNQISSAKRTSPPRAAKKKSSESPASFSAIPRPTRSSSKSPRV